MPELKLPHGGKPRVMLLSLGCVKNEVDAETALGELVGEEFTLSLSPEDADVVLINTCAFIEPARIEARETIEEILAFKKNGTPKVAVMGCYAQRYGAQIRQDYPEVDGVFGLAAYGRISKLCYSMLKGKKIVEGMSKNRPVAEGPRLLSTPISYSYLRISDGCSNHCSYCAIPLIRGKHQSRDFQTVIGEAADLDDNGIKELVIIGQDITMYAQDHFTKGSLDFLLDNLTGNTSNCRLRLMYAHPAHMHEEIVQKIGSVNRICSYLDLPIQHINTEILAKMNRKYDRAKVEEILSWFNEQAPNAVLRTSVIVGFPGETEEQFNELLEFVKEGHFKYLGAFAYSPEEDTKAADMADQVAEDTKQKRLDLIMQAQQGVTFSWLDSRVGSKLEVIVDELTEDGGYICRSEYEAPEVDGIIFVPANETSGNEYSVGDTIPVTIFERYDYDLIARVK